MKQSNSRWAVNLTALVLAAGLLIGLFTGCPQKANDIKSNMVKITVKGDENVIVNEPKTFEVAKGTKWSEVKLKVKVNYKDGYKEKGWKSDGESGYYLYDNDCFYTNRTVFAISKKIPQPNDTDFFKTDGNGVITGYTCDKEDLPKALVIPAKIGEEVITGIGESAFSGCTDLTSIDLSACTSLTKIGWNAFSGCSNLTGTIVFPASLKTIESYTGFFYDSVGAFQSCTKLQGADFSACTSLTSIGYSAFSGCTNLTEVKLPTSLTEIRWSAFKNCPIETLHIGCDIKGTIINNLTHEASVVEHLKNIKLGEGVRIIYDYAFSGCKGFTVVKLPASLTKIGLRAFSGCTGLTSIDLSGCTSLTEIGLEAFSSCTGLTSIDLSGCTSLIKIEYDTFKGYTALTEVKLPANLTEIGESAFSGCTGLTSIDLSGCTSLTKIGRNAFKGCMGLTEVKLPASLNEIKWDAFSGCMGLTSADFADKNGWKAGSTTINPIDLADLSKAAKYLRETYADKFWKKN